MSDQIDYMEYRAKTTGLGRQAAELSKHVRDNAARVATLASQAAEAQMLMAYAYKGSTPEPGATLSQMARQAMEEGWLDRDDALLESLGYCEMYLDHEVRSAYMWEATDAMDANNYLATVLDESGMPSVRAEIPDECIREMAKGE